MGKEIEENLEEIRKEFADLLYDINWHTQRGGLLPYDWIDYKTMQIIKG